MSGFSKKLTIGLAAAALVLVSMSGAQARPVDDTALSALAGAEWLHSNGSWDGTRYSTLTQLNPCNAMNLKVKWIAGLGGTTNVQATPLMHDGIIFIPQDNKVMAYDARTGDAVWKYETEMPEDWGGQFIDFFTGKHRGVGIAGNNIYFLSNECAIHAIDYKTGEQVFRFKLDRPYPKDFEKSSDGNGYFCTAGPLNIPGKLIVPTNATDSGGLQGYVQAHDLSNGKRLWAANMIPGPGEPGADTWPGDSRIYGGAGPWIIGSWDPDLKYYFTGTANAYPWNPYTERDGRGAGNMSNDGAAAIVAVNTDTGKVPWRYTVVPGDPWDYDVMQVPMLMTIKGKLTIIHPNKTCYIHYLDAKTGRYLMAPPFCDKITWAKGYDRQGVPIWDFPIPEEGKEIELWPSLLGGTNMYPNAINHKTRMMYLATREVAMSWVFEKVQIVSNVRNLGVAFEVLPGGKEIERAMRLDTGEEVWRIETEKAGYSGGMLTTAGNLTIYATRGGEIVVVNATNGQIVFQLDTNTGSFSGPITYMSDGKQQITFALGGLPAFGSSPDDWQVSDGSMLVTLGL